MGEELGRPNLPPSYLSERFLTIRPEIYEQDELPELARKLRAYSEGDKEAKEQFILHGVSEVCRDILEKGLVEQAIGEDRKLVDFFSPDEKTGVEYLDIWSSNLVNFLDNHLENTPQLGTLVALLESARMNLPAEIFIYTFASSSFQRIDLSTLDNFIAEPEQTLSKIRAIIEEKRAQREEALRKLKEEEEKEVERDELGSIGSIYTAGAARFIEKHFEDEDVAVIDANGVLCANNPSESGDLTINPYAKEGLEYLKEKGIKLVLWTSALKDGKTISALKEVGLLDYFDLSIYGDDYGVSTTDDQFYKAVNRADWLTKGDKRRLSISASEIGLLRGFSAKSIGIVFQNASVFEDSVAFEEFFKNTFVDAADRYPLFMVGVYDNQEGLVEEEVFSKKYLVSHGL